MEIVLKVKHLNDGIFQNGIAKLANSSAYPTFGTTFAISKLAKKIADETMELNGQYKKAFADCLDEKGIPLEGKKEEYDARLKDFMATDIPLATEAGPLKKIKASAISKVGLTPAEIVVLEPILDLTSAPLEAV